VENAGSASVVSSSDIRFVCDHCASLLVVDAAAKGMTLPCQRCGHPTKVPDSSRVEPQTKAAPEPEARVAELRRQLKENESQRTEITGYINQLSIQLHRWQLRLQTLNERKQQLDTELRSTK
jgi:DNA-directed RNA polymerase subunit M/transcription elongation factor TFIIS